MIHEIEAALHPLGFSWLILLLTGLRGVRTTGQRGVGWVLLALVGGIWAVAATPLAWHLLADLERPFDRRSMPGPGTADAVVMLGGTHDFTARSPVGLNAGDPIDRFVVAVDLVRQGVAGNLVLGGARYTDPQGRTRASADLLASWAHRWQLGMPRIHSLGICADTRDEAARTAELARTNGWQRIVVVSTACHLARARGVFRGEGLSFEFVGCDYFGLDGLDQGGQWMVIPRTRGLEMFRYWLHERLGMAWYQARGWIK